METGVLMGMPERTSAPQDLPLPKVMARPRGIHPNEARFTAQFMHVPPSRSMRAFVYKSSRKADTYVYLAEKDAATRIPEAMRAQLGALQFVMELELTPERRLARENPVAVMEHLASRGYHLQMPLEPVADPMHDDWGTDA